MGQPLLFIRYQQLIFISARGQTGKGANLILFGGAFMACVAGGQTG